VLSVSAAAVPFPNQVTQKKKETGTSLCRRVFMVANQQRDEGGMGKTVVAARIVSTLLLIKFEMLAEEE
jgi:hypothetical protein